MDLYLLPTIENEATSHTVYAGTFHYEASSWLGKQLQKVGDAIGKDDSELYELFLELNENDYELSVDYASSFTEEIAKNTYFETVEAKRHDYAIGRGTFANISIPFAGLSVASFGLLGGGLGIGYGVLIGAIAAVGLQETYMYHKAAKGGEKALLADKFNSNKTLSDIETVIENAVANNITKEDAYKEAAQIAHNAGLDIVEEFYLKDFFG